MKIAKIFISGHLQAVRLPKEFQFKSEEVEIFKWGNETILREKPKDLARAFKLLTSMPDYFFSCGREDAFPQDRENIELFKFTDSGDWLKSEIVCLKSKISYHSLFFQSGQNHDNHSNHAGYQRTAICQWPSSFRPFGWTHSNGHLGADP